MLHVLDSTVLIDYLRGRPAVERVAGLRARSHVAATTAINVEEIVRGLRDSESDVVRRLVDGLVVLPIDARSAWRAGEWRRESARRGVTLAQADALIGATAAEHDAVLATGNPKDFPLPGLRVDHWPVGG